MCFILNEIIELKNETSFDMFSFKIIISKLEVLNLHLNLQLLVIAEYIQGYILHHPFFYRLTHLMKKMKLEMKKPSYF
jgi:hypothetical protein